MHMFIIRMLCSNPRTYLSIFNRYGKGNKPVHLYTLQTQQDQKIETALEAAIQPVCNTTITYDIHTKL